ncbi:MAG: exosortase H [Phycisphaerae bacterium]
MSDQKDNEHQISDQGDTASRSSEGKKSPGARRKVKKVRKPRRPPPSKKPIFKFVAGLLILLAGAQLLLRLDVVDQKLIPQYLRGWAQVSAQVLNVFGENAKVYGSAISSPRFSVNIKRGCDAVQPTILFVCAVLASPVAISSKIPGLLFGLLFIMAMNLVRVISLFYIGIYMNSWFDIMHHDVWQLLFILFSIAAWGTWAVWAWRRVAQKANASVS